jgi:hypothetical protein
MAISAVLVVMSPRVAGASISWSAVNPPLPADAVPGQGVTLASSSCPVDGWCIAVGDYAALTGTTYHEAALILSESGNRWSATEAPLPSGASTADPQALLQAVTCSTVGACIAVGNYVDGSGATQGLVEQLSGGTWAPTTAVLPGDAVTGGTGAYAALDALSCPSAAACTAVGVYTSTSGTEQAFIGDWGGGAWDATAAPLPGAASGSQFIAVSCPAVGSCVATGTYLVGGTDTGLIETQSGGSWSPATLPLPAGASPSASVANNDLFVSCPAAGSCAVAGTTFDGNYEGVLDTLSGGTWTAQSAPTPGGAGSPDVQLDSVSCADAATCVAGGLVTVGGVAQGLLESLSSGSWVAQAAPVPPATLATAAIEVHDVACPSDGTCVAVGQSDVAGTVNGLFWNLSGGSWVATATPLPPDAASSSDPSFAPVACPAAGVCVAVGTYFGASGREGVIDTDPSLAATTTTMTMQRLSATSASYTAAVVGSAGAPTGTVTFSGGLDPLCIAPVVAGAATCTGPAPSGPTVLASYSGDAASAPSWGTAVNPGTPAAIAVVSGLIQATRMGTLFPYPLQVRVTDGTGVGVSGVPVTFSTPASGPSAVIWGIATVTTNAWGIATSPVLWANFKVGSYSPIATAAGVPGAALFYFSNKRK